jgi:phage gp29-like protein
MAKSRIAEAKTNGSNGSGGAPRRRSVPRGDYIAITTLDRVREQLRDQLFPQEVQNILRLALNGSLIYQERLYQKEMDTWWRMNKDINELCDAVCRAPWKVDPFIVEGQKASDSAQEKADLVARAIAGFHPNIERHQRDFKGLVRDLVHSRFLGHMVDEIHWEMRGQEAMPVCAVALPARYYGYPIQMEVEDRLMINRSGRLSNAMSDLEDFEKYPHRFVVGICQRSTAHPTVSAMFRCLAGFWLASIFGLEWLMHYAEIFGIPFRMGEYAKGDDDAKAALLTALRDLGAGGAGVFPQNAKITLIESAKSAAELPQKEIIDMANQAADILILGQTLTSDVSSTGTGGNRALGQVHQDIRDEVLEGCIDYVAMLLNAQFVRSIIELNYGEGADEIPKLSAKIDQPQDEESLARRDKILFVDMKVPVSTDYVRKHNNLPTPSDTDDIYVPPAPTPSPGGGFPVSASHIDPRGGRRPNLEHLLDNVLENLTHVSAEWLAPVRPIFRDLILMAQNDEMTDADLVHAIEAAVKRMPMLFDELNTEVLEAEMRNAMNSGLINGVTDRMTQ